MTPLTGTTEDVRWSTVLDLFAVADHGPIYILGSFAKRVTFYSQQVRALNLIDALCKTGVLYEDSRVGIVGAGVAGVTAAVAAARRKLAVTLVEKYSNHQGHTSVLWRQWLSDERAVHPHIYDWPVGIASHERAGLPLMDWTAGTAAEVVKSLSIQFAKEKETADFLHGKQRFELLQANFNEEMIKPGEVQSIALDLPGHGRRELDALILALGFGEELDLDEEEQSYWVNDGLQSAKGQWLVSGTGDGGLTDVMRLCIDKFRHAEVVRKFGEHGLQGEEELRDVDTLESAQRPNRFREVAVRLNKQLKNDKSELGLRSDVQVWLAGTKEGLFSPGASILNRLIAAYLLEQRAFKLIPYSTLKVHKLQNGRSKVTYTKDRQKPVKDPKQPTEFDGVIIRHGPKSALKATCPNLFAASAALKLKWDALEVAQDPTRSPIWAVGDFDQTSAPPLDVDSRTSPFTIVISGPTKSEQSLASLVDQALERAAGGDVHSRKAISINPEIDLASIHGYRRALRALCRSEIAIFEITELKPATMLLLGIRSVVRRGITLLTMRIDNRSKVAPPFDLPDRPFNIREVSVVARRLVDDEFAEALKQAIVEGRNQLKLLASEYQDLPAYDAVRKLGGIPENYRPIPPDTSVLVLSSYDKKYLRKEGAIVTTALGTTSPGKWQRIVETPSPQLASQKLYAAIRRTQMCVVDWTGWRPNLFFELGVRLAVNPHLPALIINKQEDSTSKEGRVLQSLFAPEPYENADDVGRILKRFRAAINSEIQVSPPNAQLSPSFTFDQVQRWMDLSEEAPMAVEEAFDKEAAVLVGPDRTTYPDSPLLYAGNKALVRKAEFAALDRWLAAWYFVDKRYSVLPRIRKSKAVPDDPLVQRWINRAFSIQSMLDTLRDAAYAGIKEEVDQVIKLYLSKIQ